VEQPPLEQPMAVTEPEQSPIESPATDTESEPYTSETPTTVPESGQLFPETSIDATEPENSPAEATADGTGQQTPLKPQEPVAPTTELVNEKNTSTEPPAPPQTSEPPGQNSQPPAEPPQTGEPATNKNDNPPTENNSPAPAPTDDGPIVLTISGNAVNAETTWSLNRLQALRDGYREITYSTTNNWPSFSAMTAQGVSLTYLLRQAGLKSNVASVKFISTDGYSTTLTYNQVFGTLYSYANHSATGSSGASAVESVVAWAWGDVGKVRPENIRPFFGQSGPWEVNTASFVKDLCKIEVSTASAGTWAAPGASIADGSTVPAGTELELSHGSMDNIRIYYTLDGSEPNYNSPVYNQSTSYFQPQLIKPLVLTESVTVKAFAAGLGKGKSAIVTVDIAVT